ncbi:hypothetical protein DHODJN_11220 [Methylorubrum extorquens]
MAAKPQGGDRRSQHIEAHADLILNLYEAQPTIFLSELCVALAEQGIATSESGLLRFFKRHGITRKKNTAHAAEQDRSDVRAERVDWFEAQDELDPDSLVFIDETAATTAMERRYGRASRGERCRVGVPQGHWKTTTITARCALAAWSPRRCSTERRTANASGPTVFDPAVWWYG